MINFLIIQFAPGGPVENTIAKLTRSDFTPNQISGGGGELIGKTTKTTEFTTENNSKYVGARGLDPETIARIEKIYGFDKPISHRFFKMIKDYLSFDFGESFFYGRKVMDLIIQRLPVSISLGVWATLIIYLISIPLGIRKAVLDGSRFDMISSTMIFIGYSIPAFLFAVMLLILFGKGGYVPFFPLSGLVSDNFKDLSLFGKVKDYFHHIALPVLAMVIGGFASLTMLTKNSFLAEINKQYVVTARAKGLKERDVLYKHIFRNAMILVISGIPAAIIAILFTSSLLIEIIFSLEGLGLLGFEAAINRDYPVIFATLYIFTFLGLVFNLIGDIVYVLVDPRIDFEGR